MPGAACIRQWLICLLAGAPSVFALTPPPASDLLLQGPSATAEAMDRDLLAEWKPSAWLAESGRDALAFSRWLGVRLWCDHLQSLPAEELEAHRQWLVPAIDDPAFTTLFFESLDPKDNFPSVLKILQRLVAKDSAAWKSHPALAIAIAVVHDAAPPPGWPHSQVAPDCLGSGPPTPEDLFSNLANASGERRLLLDLRSLHPTQLKFIVDTAISPSEIDWVRKKIHLPRSRFEKAFFQIRYRNDRIAAQAYDWTGAPYTLQGILAEGGICVDQAYYAAQAGKALGLPTLFFTGQGPDGGHAWFGFLEAPNRWNLEAGRYSRGDFPTGSALDPQTWEPVNDHELTLLSSSARRSSEFIRSEMALTLARLLAARGETARASELIENALVLCDSNPAAWWARAEDLSTSGAPAAARRTHHEKAALRFASSPDLRVAHQRELVRLLRAEGSEDEADRLQRLIEAQNQRQRSDLALSAAADRLDPLISAQDWDAATSEFLRQLRKTRTPAARGQFALSLGAPLFEALSAAGESQRLARCVAQLRRETSPARNSPLDLFLQHWETPLPSSL